MSTMERLFPTKKVLNFNRSSNILAILITISLALLICGYLISANSLLLSMITPTAGYSYLQSSSNHWLTYAQVSHALLVRIRMIHESQVLVLAQLSEFQTHICHSRFPKLATQKEHYVIEIVCSCIRRVPPSAGLEYQRCGTQIQFQLECDCQGANRASFNINYTIYIFYISKQGAKVVVVQNYCICCNNQQIYTFAMSFNAKTRKRISFTPIMLTSKAIRPIDRSDYQFTRNQRKFSGAKKQRDELSHYVFRNSSQFASTTTYGFEYPREEPDNQGIHGQYEGEDEGYKKLIRKMTTPTVVKVQFQQEMLRSKRKVQNRLRQLHEGEMEDNFAQKGKFIYFTNAKTFEQFTKMAKIRPHKRSIHLMRDEADQQWHKYLDKYYLNIRKVKPLLKKPFQQEQSSPKKVVNVSETKDRNLLKNHESAHMTKFKTAKIRTLSKRQSRPQKYGSENGDSFQEGQSEIHVQVYKKIQQDINLQRSNHKKDFFVFGLSEAVGKTTEVTVKNKFDTYRDLIFRVNFTNGLYVKNREEGQKPLKFFVGFGNNSAIIKGIMHRRFWWQLVDKITQETNFVWTQLKIGDCFKKQKSGACRSKASQNNKKGSKQEQGSTAIQKSSEQDHNRNLMYGHNLNLWEKYLSKNEKSQQKGYDQGLLKRVGGLLKKKGIKYIDNNNKLKVHNHLQSNYFLGNKKALFYSLKKYYELIHQDPFLKIPLTFHINQGIQDPQFSKFLYEFQKQNQKRKTDKQFRNIWIIKPGQFTNRGRGITVCSTLDQIKNRLRSKQHNSNGTNRTFIVQKYIQKPLLYQKRKFDIRHYMMITCHNGKIKGYWYEDGYIRTTSSEYSNKNTKDLFTHLTNDAVQKYGQDYGKYQKGNKISYHQFQKYLNNHVSPQIDFQNQIIPRMKDLATDSIRATYSVLDPQRKQHNFELFGLDFMLDENLNLYLIQVNTNPCLETSCPLLSKIITPLVQNVFKLCLDPLFPPPYEWPSQKKYNLGQNAIEENKFMLVFDEEQEGPQLKELYKNTSRIDEKMGDIFEQDEEYQDEQKQWNDEQQVSPKKEKPQ